MAGLPLDGFGSLIQLLDNLLSNTETRYIDTLTKFEIQIFNSSQLIVTVPNDGHIYQVRIQNNSTETVTLSLGKPIDEDLSENNKSNPLIIRPKSLFVRDMKGCKIYARTPKSAKLAIQVLSQKIESKDIMGIPLLMNPIVETYNYHRIPDYYKIIRTWNDRHASSLIEAVKPVNQGERSGHYLMYLSQFQPGQEYDITFDFNLKEERKTGGSTPFSIFVIPVRSILTGMFTYLASTQNDTVVRSDVVRIGKAAIMEAKDGNEYGSYPAGIHNLKMAFGNDAKIIHVDIYYNNRNHGGVITDYNIEEQKITIGEY